VIDVDLEHEFRTGTRHQFVWGGGARVNVDKTYRSPVLRFDPATRTYPVFNVFVQDEIALRPDAVWLTAGVKVEQNAFSGADVQPNVRARWQLPARQTVWGAVARAARRPTRFDDDIVVSTPTGIDLIRGDDDFRSEKLTAFEAGYRAQPTQMFSIEAAVFVHRYDRLRSQEQPIDVPFPLFVGNTLNGRAAGFELGVNVQPIPRWRTHVGYTRLDTRITRDPGSRDVSGGVTEANDPDHLFLVRTAFDLGRNVDFDAFVRGNSRLPNPTVPGYVEMNARIGWRLNERIEMALIGQDLVHDRHPEFGAPGAFREEFERAVRASLTLRLP